MKSDWISRHRVILVLFLAGFAPRLFLVLTARGIATDGCSYLWLAEHIAKGDFQSGVNAFLPPLFPMLSAGASFIFKDFELSGRMISCLAGSLTVFPLFFLIKDIFNRKIAVVTVIFYMIHPYLLRASGEVLTEATYFFLITSLAWILWMAIRNRKALLFLLVGMIASLIFLARPEGIAVIFLVLGWTWLINISKIKNEFRWKLAASFLCVIPYILLLFVFLIYIYHQTGTWQLTSRYVWLIEAIRSNTPSQNIIDSLKWQLGNNVPDLFYAVPKAYYPVFMVLLFFGLIKRENVKGFRLGEGYILSFILFRILVITFFGGVTDRYFYAFVPMALCWAGVGFWEINDHLLRKFKGREWKIGAEKISRISIIILLVIGALCLPKGLKPIRANRAIQKKAGCWLKKNAGKDEFAVMARKPQEAFYAGAKYCALRKGTYEEIIKRARETSVDFIIINKDIEVICPGFSDRVDEKDLDVFYTISERGGKKIIIYKLKYS